MLDEVERNMSGTDTMEKFNKLCEILKNGGGAINESVKNLMREIGLLYTRRTSELVVFYIKYI